MDLQRSEALGDTQLQLRGHFRVFRVLAVFVHGMAGCEHTPHQVEHAKQACGSPFLALRLVCNK